MGYGTQVPFASGSQGVFVTLSRCWDSARDAACRKKMH